MKKVFKMAVYAASVMFVFSSCATLFAGGDPVITIDGNAKEAVTIITEKQTGIL